jgi:hypothetical protein
MHLFVCLLCGPLTVVGCLAAFFFGCDAVPVPQTLTLQSALPRVARLNDTFLAGVTVHVIDPSADPTAPVAVTVTASILSGEGAVTLTGPLSQTIITVANVDTPVRFAMEVVGPSVEGVVLRFGGEATVRGGWPRGFCLLPIL